MTEEQMKILEVWQKVESRSPNQMLEIIARMTAEEADVNYTDVLDALYALSQKSK